MNWVCAGCGDPSMESLCQTCKKKLSGAGLWVGEENAGSNEGNKHPVVSKVAPTGSRTGSGMGTEREQDDLKHVGSPGEGGTQE